MSVALVDDHLLLRILLDDEPASLRDGADTIATTGLWYHRLCRALADQAVIGSMSRRLGAVADPTAAAVVRAVIDLPETVELMSLRTLGWPMARLVNDGARINLLSLEALAAAKARGAVIHLAEADDNVSLRRAATQAGVVVRTVTD